MSMANSSKRIFITGIAGFIGFHLARFLSKRGDFVVGCDSFNDYYDPALKRARAALLREAGIEVLTADIREPDILGPLMDAHQITHFVHLAAQAGVRFSLKNPKTYAETNLTGFFHVLEALRDRPTTPLIFASSSSVYGLNTKIPFSEEDQTDHPANFYGATKKSNETMARSYHHIYGIPTTALRFFTVYGPWGRPDMAYYSFTKSILEGKSLPLFNRGNMQRDFTYIDDIVEGTVAAIDLSAPFEIFNLGNNQPESLEKMIRLIENHLGKQALLDLRPMPPGEIQTTYADIEKAKNLLGFTPKTSLEEGMGKFLNWLDQYSGANIG